MPTSRLSSLVYCRTEYCVVGRYGRMDTLDMHFIATTKGNFQQAPPYDKFRLRCPPRAAITKVLYHTACRGLFGLYQGMLTYDPFCSVWVNISGVLFSALAAIAPLDNIIIPRLLPPVKWPIT